MTNHIVACVKCGKRNRVPAAAAGKPRCAQCQHWLPWIAEAADGDYGEIVEKSSVPVLVDLWATWCGPCRMVSPALEQLAGERAGELKLVKVDVDKAPVTAQRFSIQAADADDRRPWRGGGASVRRRARGGVAGLAGPSVGCAWRVIY
jgi:thioredoxin 2